MSYGGRMLKDIDRLIGLFATQSSDRSTLDELRAMVADHHLWPKGHDLFDRIRNKTLAAERARDSLRDAQYLFEEACAKTLYNLSYPQAPFDADSPYWIVPNAFALSRALGIDDSAVLAIVAA